jgi:methyl-accepting chemotaxis protein
MSESPSTTAEGKARAWTLDYNGMDEAMRATLRRGKPEIMAALPAMLDAFYRHIANFDATRSKFASETSSARARSMQMRHWEMILDARFDDAYFESTRRTGEVHYRLGVSSSAYIGAYRHLVGAMVTWATRLTPMERLRGHDRSELVNALVTVAFIDMDCVIRTLIELMERDRQAAIRTVAEDLDRGIQPIVLRVHDAGRDLEKAAGRMSEIAGETTAKSTTIAAATEQASMNVQTVATAAEELSASIDDIARRADEAASVAEAASRTMEVTAEQVNRLFDATREIGQVVGLIDSIAAQTNLLALNATIEAARAGEAGRGFSVVASEVKALATQTAKATSDIAQRIAGIQTSTEQSAGSIREIGEIIVRLNTIAMNISEAVTQQKLATGEIARNVLEASCGTRDVAGNVSAIAQATGDVSGNASKVLVTARGLSAEADAMGSELERFMAGLKTA